MERIIRLLALFAFALVLLAGCAKDVVSAPTSGAARASAKGGGENGAVTGEAQQSDEPRSPEQLSPSVQADSAAASQADPSGGDAAPPPSSDEVLLRLRLRQGDSHRFEVYQESSGAGPEAKMVISLAMKVLSVQDEVTKLELRVADARLTEGNEAAQQGIKPKLDRIKGQSVEVDVDSRGLVKDPNALPRGSILGGMLQGGLFRFTLPDKPVRVGSTWTHSANVSRIPGLDRPVEFAYKVTAIERRGGRTMVTIKSNAAQTVTAGRRDGDRPTQAQVAMNVRVTMKVDASSGLIESATSETETSISMAGRTELVKMAVRVVKK
ncbi:MAG: hypothetical protein C4341_03245 [Armatimonadota bacterium]